MEIENKISGSVNIILVNGRIDARNSSLLDDELKALIEGGSVNIIVNMEGVDYISSSGLRVLLAALKKVKPSGGDIKLSGLKPFVGDVFRISGFDSIFDICGSDKEALLNFE